MIVSLDHEKSLDMKPNNVTSSVLQKKASSQSDAPPYILKIKGLRLKGKYPYPAITYFEERLQSFGNLGCHKGCGQCFKCQTSIKFSDTAVIAYFQNLASAQTAANELGGKYISKIWKKTFIFFHCSSLLQLGVMSRQFLFWRKTFLLEPY